MKSNKANNSADVSHIIGDLDDIGTVIDDARDYYEGKNITIIEDSNNLNVPEDMTYTGGKGGWEQFQKILNSQSNGEKLRFRKGTLMKIDRDIGEALEACNFGCPKYAVVNSVLRYFILTFKKELCALKKGGISLLDDDDQEE